MKSVATVNRQQGDRLRAYFESGPPRPSEVARVARVSRQFVDQVLAGKAKASPKLVAAFASLGVPVDEIFAEIGDEEPSP